MGKGISHERHILPYSVTQLSVGRRAVAPWCELSTAPSNYALASTAAPRLCFVTTRKYLSPQRKGPSEFKSFTRASCRPKVDIGYEFAVAASKCVFFSKYVSVAWEKNLDARMKF
jgi:hypothetical protein